MKVILGKNYGSYEEALDILKVDSLNDRREKMALRFAKTSLNNPNFSKLFPLRKVDHLMKVRNSEKYVVNTSNTKRYQESAVPFLQGLLNKDDFEKRQSIKRLFKDESKTRNTKRFKSQ